MKKQKILEQLAHLLDTIENLPDDEFARRFDKCVELHADGVKEVKCEFCIEPCGMQHCCMKQEKEQ